MRIALRLALSALLIALLFTYVVDARQMLRILGDFRLDWLLLALLTVTLDRILMTCKWLLLLRAQGHRVPLLQGVTIYCASMVWGLALPATIGADAIRAVLTTRRGVAAADVVSSIVIERIIGFILALSLGIVSLLILRSVGVLDAAYDQALYAGLAVLAGSVALLLASMNEALVRRATARLPRALRESRLMGRLQSFTGAYHSLGSHRTAIARFGALTTIEQVFAIVFPWTLARGLDVPVDLLLLLGVLPLSTLISRLPVSFDGLGVFEAVFVGLLMLAGISAEAALAIAISGRVIQLIAFLPWWFAYVVSSGAARPPVPEERSDPSSGRLPAGLGRAAPGPLGHRPAELETAADTAAAAPADAETLRAAAQARN